MEAGGPCDDLPLDCPSLSCLGIVLHPYNLSTTDGMWGESDEFMTIEERRPFVWDNLTTAEGSRNSLRQMNDIVQGHVGDYDPTPLEAEFGIDPNDEESQSSATDSPDVSHRWVRVQRPFMLELDGVFIQTSTGIVWRQQKPFLLWDLDPGGCKFNGDGLRDMRAVPNPPPKSVVVSKPMFVIGQWYHRAYYHMMIESMTRVSLFLDEVIARDMLVLSPAGKMPQLLELVGIKKENIIVATSARFITAQKVFLPTTSSCGVSHPLAARKWNEILTDMIRSKLLSSSADRDEAIKNRTLLVIKRRPGTTRSVVNHDEFVRELRKSLPQQTIVEFTGEEDAKRMAVMFFQAKVIVAPHGAGLSNMVFSRKGTKVVEVMFAREPNYCYTSLSSQLDFEYHNVIGGRSGQHIVYNVNQTVALVRRALRHWNYDRAHLLKQL